MDTTREGVVDEPMARGGLHVGDHVPVHAGVAVPHEDLAEDDLPITGGGAGGDERRAVVVIGSDLQLLVGGHEGLAGQRVRCDIDGTLELAQVDDRVDGHDVAKPDRLAPDLGAGRGSAVGDAAHLAQVLLIVDAQEQRVALEAHPLPAGLGIVLVGPHAELEDVVHDLVCHQGAVLVAALVGLALDVHEDPAAIVVAEARPRPAHGVQRDRLGDVVDPVQCQVVEPDRPARVTVVAEVQAHPVLGLRGEEQGLDPRPAGVAAHRRRVVGEREGGHAQTGRHRGGVARRGSRHHIQGADPAADPVQVADVESHRFGDHGRRTVLGQGEPQAAATRSRGFGVEGQHRPGRRGCAVEAPASDRAVGCGLFETRVAQWQGLVGNDDRRDQDRGQRGSNEERKNRSHGVLRTRIVANGVR